MGIYSIGFCLQLWFLDLSSDFYSLIVGILMGSVPTSLGLFGLGAQGLGADNTIITVLTLIIIVLSQCYLYSYK